MRTIRSARFRRPMGRLALLAILLLSLVPTLGRLAQARAAGVDPAPSWAALCTVRGLEQVALLPATPLATQAGTAVPDATPAPPRGTDAGDCDYCPLLALAVPVTIAPASVPPAALPPALCTSHPSPSREQPHPCGLGSRGPPTAS